MLSDSFGALRNRDFRLFWVGAFVSFLGSWIQNTGQGWLVFHITGSEKALGLMQFIGASPMFFLSPLGGWIADRSNKRVVLVIAQLALATTAFVLAAAVWFNFVSFPLIASLAFVNGCTSVIEIPARQSSITNIVPPEQLANALPLNSATFNVARILGPVIGGQLLAHFGPAGCYFLNGISFAALVFAVLAIRADLRSTAERSASLGEALFGGIKHVMQTPAFRTIVSMMMCSAVFGLFYLSLLPAVAIKVLHVGREGYAALLTATGVGAVLGVLIITTLSTKAIKGWIPIISMIGLGASLLAFSFITKFVPAVLCLGCVGMFGLGQMVGTNTALQYFSPPELRGRLVSVHVWSLAGLSPVGAIVFGFLSENYGLAFAFRLGGAVVLFVGLLALMFGRQVRSLA